ncbi:MAG: hypothetical protein ACRYGP_28910 [Janthinobacterium lividum]
MMMTFATELVRFYDQAVADDYVGTAVKIKGLRACTEALRAVVLDSIEPDWQVEAAFGKLRDAAALYSRSTVANPDQRRARFSAFNVALGDFAAALDGAEPDPLQIAGRLGFSSDPVPNPLADLAQTTTV